MQTPSRRTTKAGFQSLSQAQPFLSPKPMAPNHFPLEKENMRPGTVGSMDTEARDRFRFEELIDSLAEGALESAEASIL